jgi:hypothetical protein
MFPSGATTRRSPVAERAWFRGLLEEPDPRRQLELLARNSGHIKRRTAALVAVMRRAAQAEAEIGDLWQAFEDQFRENQRLVAQSVAAKGRLRDELEAAEAAEIIGLLNHPFVY